MKLRAKTKKKYKESMKQKSGSLKKIKMIDKLLAKMTNIRGEKTQISKIRNKKGEITTNNIETQGIIRDHFENLYSNKLENYEEMDKFLDIYDHPKLNQEDTEHLNKSITHNNI
jgi:hypothetical protein